MASCATSPGAAWSSRTPDVYQRAVAAADALWRILIQDPELDSDTRRRYEDELRDFRRFAGKEQSR